MEYGLEDAARVASALLGRQIDRADVTVGVLLEAYEAPVRVNATQCACLVAAAEALLARSPGDDPYGYFALRFAVISTRVAVAAHAYRDIADGAARVELLYLEYVQNVANHPGVPTEYLPLGELQARLFHIRALRAAADALPMHEHPCDACEIPIRGAPFRCPCCPRKEEGGDDDENEAPRFCSARCARNAQNVHANYITEAFVRSARPIRGGGGLLRSRHGVPCQWALFDDYCAGQTRVTLLSGAELVDPMLGSFRVVSGGGGENAWNHVLFTPLAGAKVRIARSTRDGHGPALPCSTSGTPTLLHVRDEIVCTGGDGAAARSRCLWLRARAPRRRQPLMVRATRMMRMMTTRRMGGPTWTTMRAPRRPPPLARGHFSARVATAPTAS